MTSIFEVYGNVYRVAMLQPLASAKPRETARGASTQRK